MVTKLVTDLKVSPPDWLTNPLSVQKPWKIWYRYQGKLVKIMGMNREKQYRERVTKTRQLLTREQEKLTLYGYNPLDKSYLVPLPNIPGEMAVNSNTRLLEALQLGYDQLQLHHTTLLNIKSCIKYVAVAAKTLGFNNLQVGQISRKHIKLIMNQCNLIRPMSERTWNSYRAYLMMIFEQLLELELVDHNPAREIKKKRETIKIRQILTHEERIKIKDHLRTKHPDFYRFIQIFFHSGGRRTELLSLRVKDVNLLKSEYTTLIRKGEQKRYVIRVIKTVAFEYWQEQLCNAQPEHYVFSVGLQPGPVKIDENQVTKRWKVHVKEKLGITADLYSLKHLNTDETAAILGIEAAAAHNSHTSTKITLKHYALGEGQRMREKLKGLSNEL